MTLKLFEKRDAARANNEYYIERLLTRQIKNHVKAGCAFWVDSRIANHDQAAIRKSKSKPSVKSTPLKNSEGHSLTSEYNAETLAEYFERMQGAVRPIECLPSDAFARAMIDVNCGDISFAELREGVGLIKHNKQCGADDIPGEFWKSICLPGSLACNWIMQLFDVILSKQTSP